MSHLAICVYLDVIVCIAILPACRVLDHTCCCLTHICRRHWYRQLVKFDQCYWLPRTCGHNSSPYCIDDNLVKGSNLTWWDERREWQITAWYDHISPTHHLFVTLGSQVEVNDLGKHAVSSWNSENLLVISVARLCYKNLN